MNGTVCGYCTASNTASDVLVYARPQTSGSYDRSGNEGDRSLVRVSALLRVPVPQMWELALTPRQRRCSARSRYSVYFESPIIVIVENDISTVAIEPYANILFHFFARSLLP